MALPTWPVEPVMRMPPVSLINGLLNDAQQVLAVGAFGDAGCQGAQLTGINVAEAVGDLLGTGHLEALAMFEGGNKIGCFEQRIVCSGVEPSDAAAEELGAELAALEVPAVDVGDLELATGRGFQLLGDLNDLGVIEVDAGDGVAGFGFGGFLFKRDGFAVGVELDDAVALGIEDGVGEDGGARGVGGGVAEGFGEVVAVEDVIAEDEAAVLAGEECPCR